MLMTFTQRNAASFGPPVCPSCGWHERMWGRDVGRFGMEKWLWWCHTCEPRCFWCFGLLPADEAGRASHRLGCQRRPDDLMTAFRRLEKGYPSTGFDDD